MKMNITKQELSKCICLIYKEVLAAPSYPLDVTVIEEAIHPLHTASPRIKNPEAGSFYGMYNTIILQ